MARPPKPLRSEAHPEGIPEETAKLSKKALKRLKDDTHMANLAFFLLDAAWVGSRAERPSVSYTKVTSKVAWTGHNLQFTKTNSSGSNKFRKKGGREDETDARAVRSDPLARRIA